MSLVRAAIRISAVAALREKCWPSIKIRDSDNRPLDVAASTATQPYAVVYTDADETDHDADTRRTLDLIIEFGLTKPIPADAQHGPAITIPADTDANLELMVDAIGRQVENAIVNPIGKWAPILRGLTNGTIINHTSGRGGSAEAARWAARQVIWHLQPIDDPVTGEQVHRPLLDFIDAAKADPNLATVGGFMEAILSGNVTEAWRQAQTILWLSDAGISGIGLAPVKFLTDTDHAPLLGSTDTAIKQDIKDSIDEVVLEEYMQRGN